MNKHIAYISGDLYFTEKDLNKINKDLGGNELLVNPQCGAGGEICEVVLNFTISVLSGISVELLVLMIKTIYKKAKKKLKSKKRNDETPIIVINSYNYGNYNTNFNFTIDLENPDINLELTAKTIINLAKQFENIEK